MKKGKWFLSVLLTVVMTATLVVPENTVAYAGETKEESSVDTTSLENLLADRLTELQLSEESLPEQTGVNKDLVSTDTVEAVSGAAVTADMPWEVEGIPYKEWKENKILRSSGNNRAFLRSMEANYISNDYIALQLNNGAYFNLGTTGGNPNSELDNDKDLLYGWPESTTSMTTIRIDGNDYEFSTQEITLSEEEKKITATMVISEFYITVQQICSLDINPNTGRQDMAKFHYNIINNDIVSHDIGVRIMMDTMLGDNDGAPFKVPGYGNVTTEIEMSGTRVPQYWQAFDNLDNPTVVASGMLYKAFNEKPDKVQFAAWPDIVDTFWDYPVTEGKILTNDSAVAVYYNPKTVEPASSRSIATYYGIGDFSSYDNSEDLSVRVTAPQELVANTTVRNYYSNPYTVTCYIKNNGTTTIQNAVAELFLPETNELSISSPGSRIINLGDIAPQEEKALAYTILAASQSVDKTINYSIQITSDNHAVKNIPLLIKLPMITGLEGGSITLDQAALTLSAAQTYTLHATLVDIDSTITWFSNKPSIAKVNANGVVTAVSPGTATIIATAGGKSASCIVTVTGNPVTLSSIAIEPSSMSLNVNQTKTLTVRFSPVDAPNKQIRSWTSDRPDIAVVSGGRVTGIKAGTATITGISQDGNKQATCTVTVVEPEPILSLGEGISFNQQVPGPTISFAGKDFPLFKLKVGAELKLGNSVKLVYDYVQDKYVAYFGDMHEKTGTNDTNPDGTLTDSAKQLRRDTYREIKNLMSLVGKKPNRDFYNAYRKLISKSSPFSVTGNKTVFGYVELVYSNGNYVISGGEVCALFEAGVEFKYNLPPVPVVYLKFGISGTLQTGLKLKLKTSGELLSGLTVFGKVEGKLKPFIGVGGDVLVAKVEGGFEGEVKSVIQFPINDTFTPQRDFSLSLSGNLYLKAKAFVFINAKLTYQLFDYSIYPGNNASARSISSMAINEDTMKLIPRDYLDDIAADRQITSLASLSSFALESGFKTTDILTNTYPYGEPQIISLGSGKYLLVYIGDVASRSSENRTGLYYTIFDGTNWSEPLLVSDDSTADFSPVLAGSGNNVYVAWQNIEKTLEQGSAIGDFSSNSGITVAKFNGASFESVKNITKADGYLDFPPVITVSGEKAAVFWVKNQANDVFGMTNSNSIYRSVYNGETWSEAAAVVEDAGYIGQLSASYLGTDPVIVYAKDMDQQLDTVDDIELMLMKGNEAPVNLTNNNVMDNNPVLSTNSTGTTIYWESGDKICYSDTLSQLNPMEIGASAGGNFTVVDNGTKKAILWEQSTGYASELTGIFYDNNSWGVPVQITNDGKRIRETSAIIGDDGKIYFTYMSAEINQAISDTEADPTGQTALVVAQLSPYCDLEFGSSIAYDENQVQPNGTVSLGAYIQNNGNASVTGFHVYVSNGVGSETEKYTFTIPLASGKGSYIDIPYTLPAEITSHQVVLTVEAFDSTDSVPSNNSATVTIGGPVVTVTKPLITGMGNYRTVTATIVNNGYSSSTPLTVNLYLNSMDNAPTTTQTVSSVQGKSSRTVEFLLPISGDSFTEGDVLVYIGVNNGEVELCNSSVMYQPEPSNSLTISNAAQIGNVILLNLDNNLPSAVNGTLLITGMNNYDNQVAQSITIDGLGSQPMQLGIAALGEEEALTLRVLGEDDSVISNIVTVFKNGALQVEKPYAVPESGTFTNNILVTLQCPDSQAKIYYTMDGSNPTIENALEYTGAFVVSRTATVKAIAVREGYANSDVVTYEYVLNIGVTGVSLDKSALELTVGGAGATLAATITPENATNKNVTWTSNNEAVARVVNGVVTPISAGTAMITVITDDGNYSASARVTVTGGYVPGGNNGYNPGYVSVPVIDSKLPRIKDSDIVGWEAITKDLKANPRNVIISMNESTVVLKELFETIKDKNMNVTFILKNNYEWMINGKTLSKDSAILSISEADLSMNLNTDYIPKKLTEGFAGGSFITFSITDKYSNNYNWTVKVPLAKEQSGKYANLFYYDKQTDQLKLVDISAINSQGYTEFQLTNASNYVIVIKDRLMIDEDMKQISVGPLKKTLYVGGTTEKNTTLEVSIPAIIKALETEGLYDISVTYKSSNTKVATVSSEGKVIAKKAGKATISTTIKVNGVEKSFLSKITVKKAYIKLTKTTDMMKQGDTFSFQAEGYGFNLEDITYATSVKSVIVINKATGEATAKSKGTDYVIAKSGKVTVKVKVKVS